MLAESLWERRFAGGRGAAEGALRLIAGVCRVSGLAAGLLIAQLNLLHS
jgi:hypothetical protein